MSIDDDLRNWARWVRGRTARGHCASIEHRYHNKLRPDMTPTGWGDWIPAVPPPVLPPIDALQALEVERTMRHLPDGHRRALVLYYVARLPYKGCCRALHLGYDRWPKFLADAQCMVANLLLQRRAKCASMRSTIRKPAQAEYIGA